MMRRLAFAGLLIGSLVPTYMLSAQAVHDFAKSEQVVRAALVGAAYEDILGFGFWAFWAILFVSEAAVLLAAWFTLKRGRYLISMSAGAFIVASILGYFGFEHVRNLVAA